MVQNRLSHPIIAGEKKLSASNYHPLPVVLTKGRGVWLWDDRGKRYLDMMSAYSAVGHGHCHPKLLAVLHQQSQQLCLCSRAFYQDQSLALYEKLHAITKQDKCMLMNTGAEAVETAIKAARRWGHFVKKIPENQAEIIVAKNNFHGRTTTIISFSCSKNSTEGFGPLTPGFKIVPFGDIGALSAAISKNTCAVLLEPIQGEAGIQIPPAGWLAEVNTICKQQNILLILDEIQSGLGRTGKLFAYQHEGIEPDGLILGKSLGGGILPVSAFLTRKEVMDVFTPGSHGSTFAGSPLAASVALRALELLEEEALIQNSANLGRYLLERLQAMDSDLITDIRGRGLWVGIDLDTTKTTGRRIAEQLLQLGVLSKETQHKTIRIAPPLVIQKDELDWGIRQLERVFCGCGQSLG